MSRSIFLITTLHSTPNTCVSVRQLSCTSLTQLYLQETPITAFVGPSNHNPEFGNKNWKKNQEWCVSVSWWTRRGRLKEANRRRECVPGAVVVQESPT